MRSGIPGRLYEVAGPTGEAALQLLHEPMAI
jgi:hypothetical protein